MSDNEVAELLLVVVIATGGIWITASLGAYVAGIAMPKVAQNLLFGATAIAVCGASLILSIALI